MEIDFQEIIALLSPGTARVPGGILFDIMLYAIFIFGMLSLFLIPDKNLVPTLLTAGVLMFAIIAKLSISAPPRQAVLNPREFGMLIVNIGMGVFPLLAAGTTRKVRTTKTAKSIPFAILTGLIGISYFLLFWALVQR